MRKKLLTILIIPFVCSLLCTVALPASVSAAKPEIPAGCPGSQKDGKAKPGVCDKIPAGCPGSSHKGKPKPESQCPYAAPAKDGGKAEDKCAGSECTNTPTGQGKNCDGTDCDLVALYLNPAIQLLSIVVGLVVAASLIMGGIQYTASSGDPQKTGAAKSRIQNTLLAFLAYAFLYAFLNFLIPGGLFK